MFKENLEQMVSACTADLLQSLTLSTMYIQEENYEEERLETTDWATEDTVKRLISLHNCAAIHS